MRSAAVFALRLHDSTMPCSVPTMNLVGPATASYSRLTAPSTVVWPRSVSCSDSTGSLSLRVSHQCT